VTQSTDTTVHFTISVPNGFIEGLQWSEDPHIDGIEQYFKLTTSKGLSLNNIHLYNEHQRICKYQTIHKIQVEFYKERYKLYVKRKNYQLKELENNLTILESKIQFIKEVMDDLIQIYRRKKTDIIQSLVDRGYPLVDKGYITETGSYDYLLKISLYGFTEEEIQKLETTHGNNRDTYTRLTSLSVEDMWLQELEECLKHLK
jgi:DNA topoisomerase II